jgi:hypothetical protein
MSVTRYLIAAALASAAASSPVCAMTAIFATYQGTASGTDGLGLFGAPGSALLNTSFTAVFTIFDLPGELSTAPGLYSEIAGGADYGDGAPVSAVLTINGVSLSLGGYRDGSDSQFARSPYFASKTEQDVEDYTPDGGRDFSLGIESTEHVVESNYNVLAPNSYVFKSGDTVDGGFTQFDVHTGQQTSLTFAPIGVTFSTGEAIYVPEPAGWALLLIGFGAVGAMIRGSRRGTLGLASG